ncbi:hypothetical protein BofuT4_P102230.1 [Botrytis cinerea T4]|uniref:Uncharacterized protein n=1 Tax=Botryotinia fuckeliana (strain T4) TaxID=999810 RepID=G2YBD1_BOTF4|nr:hypothetical protein BofuT4_P102230.1 [Botrytis cinerea T4]
MWWGVRRSENEDVTQRGQTPKFGFTPDGVMPLIWQLLYLQSMMIVRLNLSPMTTFYRQSPSKSFMQLCTVIVPPGTRVLFVAVRQLQ